MKKSFTAKLWKVMKICAVQGIIAITLCGVTIAHTNYAQLLDREVSISITDLPFEKALHEIEAIAKVKFAYSISQLQDEPNVSLAIDKRPLREALDELLAPRKISYKVHEKEAAITLKKINGEGNKERSSVHEGTNGYSVHRALIQITGTVTEASTQTPMAGVNVLVKGTLNGTTTDATGKYSLGAEDNDILVFSFIGYAAVEITVSGRSVIDVSMTEDVLSLNEVVVNAGYWEVKDQERTGNISRVTYEEIQKQPVNNLLQALQGRMPGVYVQQSTGVPGGGFNIQIRGRNSLRDEGNDPLYIIDGVPFTSTSLTTVGRTIVGIGNPLAAINPNDIESIEVLKDADATAVYGSRGANGVVLITTKKGKSGRTKVDFTFLSGVGTIATKMDLLNTPQYVEMRKEAFKNDNRLMTVLRAPDILVWDTTRYTDWQKELIGGTANTINTSLSVSGGNANTQFSFSSGYYKETTVFPGNFYFQRFSGSLNVNHTSSNGKFKFNVSANYTGGSNNLYSQDLTGIALTLPPNAPALYDSSQKINWNWKNTTIQNPLAHLERKYTNNTDNLVTSTLLSYQIIPGLHAKTSVGYTRMAVNEISTNPLSAIPPQFLSTQTGSSSFGNAFIETWIVEPQLDYFKEIGQGNLSILMGTTFQESIQEGETIQATGYTSDALLENILAATDVNVASSNYTQYRYAAIFGRANYIWKEKYIVNLTGRRDGSSRFGPGKQFGNFGAIGLAWIFSNEQFIKSGLPFLSSGKLRSSYGSTGSDAIGNYQYLNSYLSTTYPYNGTSGLVISRLANPDYSWETNRKLELGIELGFIKDAITFSASWYKNRSSNQLVGLPLPVITGQSSVQFNLPATVENTGWELQINTVNVKHSRFEWLTTFNVTIPKNKLVEFPNLDAFPAYNNIYQEGSSLFLKRTLQSNGVDPTTGSYTFADVNEDGSVSIDEDGLFLKEIAQSYYGGINNHIRFGRVQLDIFFQFVNQTGSNYMKSFSSPGMLSNQPNVVLGRWQESGDNAIIQRYSSITSIPYIYNRFSDNVISDASFIRLKNASLSWQLPEKWMKKLKITGAKVNVQGQNLLTFTNFLGMDPESQNVSFLPPLRVVAAGFQLTL
ncbi:MAG: TonB-dependent receptor [Cyclobacteriaceae bacterium]|nr:TonB-dependent receptor [Cyclobacteriaceae bacterium]